MHLRFATLYSACFTVVQTLRMHSIGAVQMLRTPCIERYKHCTPNALVLRKHSTPPRTGVAQTPHSLCAVNVST